LINQGTPPNPDARATTLQNFATLKALALQSLADLDNYNLVLGACPRLMEQTFTNYIAHEITGHGGHGISLVERGLTYQQDVVSIAFNALGATDKGSRETHHDEKMEGFGTAVGEGFDKYMVAAINTINIFFSGELCYSVHRVPMLLLLGTPKAEQYMFDSESIGTDGCKTCRLDIVGPAIPHSQGWFEDFIKSNYTDEEKAQICAIMWRFYLPLLQRLGIGKEESITTVRTRIAHKWGKKMSKEEIEAKQQNRREIGQRASKAWAAYMNDKANADQIKYVESTGFGKNMLGWRKYKEDPLSVPLDLQLYLVKGNAWKAHKARILCMGEEGAELAAQIASIEASANAEMERRKVEKMRIEAENEKRRLDNINKELEYIEKIDVTKRTDMHTIRYNLLRATLSKDRREQVRWREQFRAENKRLKNEKAVVKRQKIEHQIKSLSTNKRTEEEEFQFNVLKAELRGDKNKVKRLKIEKELKSIPYNRTEKQQSRFDFLNAQLRGDKNEVKRLKIEEKARRDDKAEVNRLKIERIKLLQEQQQQQQQQQNVHTQLSVVFPWLSQAEQQQQQQLVQQQFLLSQEEQLILQQYSTIGKRQQERLLQIQQQKQQNLVAYMQLQSKSQQQQYLQQLQSQQPTTQTSSQARKTQSKPFNYKKVMKLLPEQLDQATAYEFVEKADEMFEEEATDREKGGRWAHFRSKLNPHQLSLIEVARTHLKRKKRMQNRVVQCHTSC